MEYPAGVAPLRLPPPSLLLPPPDDTEEKESELPTAVHPTDDTEAPTAVHSTGATEAPTAVHSTGATETQLRLILSDDCDEKQTLPSYSRKVRTQQRQARTAADCAPVDSVPQVLRIVLMKRAADEASTSKLPSKKSSKTASKQPSLGYYLVPRPQPSATAEQEIITIDDDDDGFESFEREDDNDFEKTPPPRPRQEKKRPAKKQPELKQPEKKLVDVGALLQKPTKHMPSSPTTVEKAASLERYRSWIQVGRGLRAFFRVVGDRATIAPRESDRAPEVEALAGGNQNGRRTFPTPPRVEEYALEPAQWPFQVGHLASNYNPSNIRFAYQEGFGKCECQAPCRVHTCRNACLGLFCTETSCSHKAKCGNGLTELDGLRIQRIVGTKQLTLITRKPIDRGVVVGQYVGELSLVRLDREQETQNEGYRLYMHRDDLHKRNERVCINAFNCGSRMRFVNHSCDPAACFMEMANGYDRAVVVVTTRRVNADEELTVHYGDQLWFDCRCAICRAADAEQ